MTRNDTADTEAMTQKRYTAAEEWTLADVANATTEFDSRIRIEREAIDLQDYNPVEQKRSEIDGIAMLLHASHHSTHLEYAVIYDGRCELYAVVSAHKRSDSWNSAEYDWKVNSIGSDVRTIVDQDDFDDEGAADGWSDWVSYDVVKYGISGGIHELKPIARGVEIVVVASDQMGIIGDRFSATIEAF